MENFCYLVSTITKNEETTADVMNKINRAHQAFGALNATWRPSHLSLSTKMYIFITNTISILSCGYEIWQSTVIIKFFVFVNSCLRTIFSHNTNLMARTDRKLVSQDIKERKWRP